MLCPFCQRGVTAFTNAPDNGGLRCPHPDCVGADDEVPVLYGQDYARHPAVPVSIFGPTGHGKTMFVESLLTHLERRIRWPDFSCQWMDQGGMMMIRQRLRMLRETGQLADATARVFPRPMVLRLRNVPRVGGCQLLMYDTSGETFASAEDLADSGRYVKHSPAVVWLVSLTELEYPEQLSDLMTVYAQAMAKMGADPKNQSIVFTLTKADLLLTRPDLPQVAKDFLANDELDPNGTAWNRLDAVSDALKAWLLDGDHRNVVNLLLQQFRGVKFCLLSAQGAAAEGGQLQMDLMPRGVLAPLFWVWRLTRACAVVETGTAKTLHFDMAAAVAGAPAGSTVRIEPGTHPLSETLKIGRPLVFAGTGPAAVTLLSTAADCAVGVKTAGRVEFRGLTLAHAGAEPADVIRLLGGELHLDNCAVRNAVTLLPKVPGDGVVAAGKDAALTAANATFAGNGGNGVSSRGGATVRLHNCTLEKNAWAGAVLTDAEVNVTGGTFAENGGPGLQLGGATRAAVAATTFRKNKKSGLTVGGTAQAKLDGNACDENGTHGLAVRDSAQVLADKTGGKKNEKCGVSFADTAGGKLAGGTFAQNGGAGVEVLGDAAPDVAGNRFTDNKGPGATFGGNAGGTFAKNVCDANAGVGLLVVGTAAPVATANRLAGNANGDRHVAPTAKPRFPDENAPAAAPAAKKGWLK